MNIIDKEKDRIWSEPIPDDILKFSIFKIKYIFSKFIL